MRQKFVLLKKLLFFVCALLFVNYSIAQDRTVAGTVTDGENGDPLPGVSIAVKGYSSMGTVSRPDGNFSLSVPDDATTLIFSFVGYKTKEVAISDNMSVTMEVSSKSLDEIVIIGYGEQRKGDATGSVTAIGEDDFNKGSMTSPQDLLIGRTAGVQITTEGGAPGSSAKIRIRGGSSLSASNDPLIVIDGVPLDNEGINGMRNPLNTIHPSDIESFTVLKDASATAIYGSRASNGVIIITTKKGKAGAPLRLNYNGKVSIQTVPGTVDVLSADEYRTLVTDHYGAGSNPVGLLGSANTDWQSEIFETAIGHDHNISATGSVKNLPYRASFGYSDQSGILKTTELDRITFSAGVNPTFLDDHLKVDINAKGMSIKNRFPDKGAIGSAITFDPTQPVMDEGNDYGGYFAWLNSTTGLPIDIAPTNPLALLEQRNDESDVMRGIGNAQIDYKFHFLPELRANLNMGYDFSESNGTIIVPEAAAFEYDDAGSGINREYKQEKTNSVIDFYLNYVKEVASIESRFDIMAGYSWQRFWRKGSTYETNFAGTEERENTDYETESYLVSFFGRFNYSFKDRYLLTFTLRRDGSSRFAEDARWGTFPSAAFAWKLSEEPFMQSIQALSNLKLRLGYGVTGQQNLTTGDYPYLARYTYSEDNARYLLGDTYYTTLRPEGYDANLKWEETYTYNVGLDFGFFKERFSGSIDIYQRVTEDLINEIPVPAGTNLTNRIVTNVGSLENKGFELTLTGRPVVTDDMFWEVGFNLTYNQNEITKLTAAEDPTYQGVETGGIAGGVGNNIQIHSVGFPSSSFYVWEQVYDEDGYPIEGLYVDRNQDGIVNDEDKYRYENPAADVFMGFSSRFTYKQWEFSFAGRVNIGNYVYNNISSQYGVYSNLYNSVGYLNNVTPSLYDTRFNNPKYRSDFYLENASFMRMDHITLGYTFENLMQDKLNMYVYGTVQNAFVITKYSGLDPEVTDGIDNNVYPRPRTFVLGLNINF